MFCLCFQNFHQIKKNKKKNVSCLYQTNNSASKQGKKPLPQQARHLYPLSLKVLRQQKNPTLSTIPCLYSSKNTQRAVSAPQGSSVINHRVQPQSVWPPRLRAAYFRGELLLLLAPPTAQSSGTPLHLRMTLARRLAKPGLGSSTWKVRVRRL